MKATKYQRKSQIKLEDLLRRRKSNLKLFITETGITTYEGLDSICKRLGVLTPTQNAFIECIDKYVSNPAAGVIVIPPPVVLDESTGNPEIENDDSFEDLQPQISVTNVSENGEISVVLKEATVSTNLTKKERKRIKKQQNVKFD